MITYKALEPVGPYKMGELINVADSIVQWITSDSNGIYINRIDLENDPRFVKLYNNKIHNIIATKYKI